MCLFLVAYIYYIMYMPYGGNFFSKKITEMLGEN